MSGLLDLVAGLLLVAGALLCLCAAIGLVRFPDLLSRMHTATKPQTLGVVLVMLGVGVGRRSPLDFGMLALVALLQMLTAPVASHLMSRTALRSGQVTLPHDHRQHTGADAVDAPGAGPRD